MRTWLARTGLVLLSALSTVAVGACAEERDPIDRTQPGILPKTFFVGKDLRSPTDDPEFRVKAFTVGSTVSQSTQTIGEFTAVDRIKWEITEDLLIGRRSYQEVAGADNRAQKKTDGTVVAAYKILSHFDVRREYNPTTGEESNVIVENSSDRPWTDREFMRVDWSKNLVDSTNDSARFFKYGGKVTPVEYAITDPKAEDAPHVELDAGYFDVTNKFTVESPDVEFPWGSIKECVIAGFLNGSASYDCNPQEATVRLSFAKVQADEDFERFEDTNAWRDVVGNWGGSGDGANPWLGAPRESWDPQYGVTDASTKRFKAIHNIWQKSHQAAKCSTNEDKDGNGTADACENGKTGYAGHSGSQCDVYEQKCTIPVRDRKVKTIAYHLNKEAPAELQDEVDEKGNFKKRGTLEDLPYSWNQMLEVSVAYRREVECRKTGDGDRAACHAQYFEGDGSADQKVMVSFGGWLIDKVKKQDVDKGAPVLSACHNPVRSYDPEACGKPGDVARHGDIRKNFLIYWPYESRAHYGGVGANPPDPLTGETHGATATIMGRSATYAAAMQRDIVQLAMGDTSVDDVIKGVPAQRYAKMLQSGDTAPAGLTKGLGDAEVQARLDAVDLKGLKSAAGLAPLAGGSALERGVQHTKERSKSSVDLAAYSRELAEFDAVASKLRGTPWEAQIVDQKWLAGALGADPRASASPAAMDLASPLRGMDPARVDAMHAWYTAKAEAKGECFDDAMMAAGAGSVYQASLAGHFKAKYGSLDPVTRGKRIYEDLWREAVKGIGLHELGHSLGLRHNFASSWDAPNFNPQYWQLRTNESQSTGACSSARSGDKDSCMGPRYLDPMTKDEQGLDAESRPGIDYFANTSTMEYQLERFGETVGLGTYDLHAMKTLYGRVLETFDDKVVPAKNQLNFAPKSFTQLQERDLVIDGGKIFSHYTKTARLMKVFDAKRDCRPATDEEKATAGWRVVHGKVCSPAPKDHWSFEDFKSDEIPRVGISGVKWHAIDKDGKDKVRWTYRYGEQYGAGGYMHTVAGDSGADAYEVTQNHVRRFDLGYPWAYFRRGNREYNSMFLPQSTASRFFSRVRSYHWQIATDLGRADAAELVDDDGMRPYVMAQNDIFSFLTRAVMMPEPGNYAQSATRTPVDGKLPIFDLAERSGGPALGAFTLGIVDGRYIGEEFDNDLGGSWDYQKYVSHAGFEVEKSMAMLQLVDPRPTLFTIARDNFLDGRATKINFRTDLPEATDRLLGGLLAEDWESIAPGVVDPAAGVSMPLDFTKKSVVRPQGSKILFPNIGYKQQLAMGMYAVLFSRLNSDMTLANKMRIWMAGDPAPAVPGTREIRFLDPKSGYTYVASRFGDDVIDGKTVDRGVASRMLAHANALLAATYKVKRDAQGAPVLAANGLPELLLDASGAPQVESPDMEAVFRRYVGLIDSMRQIDRALAQGPLGGGSGPGGEDDSTKK